MKNKWIWIIVALFVALLSWRIYVKVQAAGGKDGESMPNRKGNQAVAVETGKVVTLDMTDTGLFSGTLVPKSRYILAPKISGQLSKLHVNIGDTVNKGQLLAELDDRIAKQDFEKAKAALGMAKATAEQTADAMEISEQELLSQRELLNKSYISQTEFNQTNSLYISNKSKHNIALASLQSAQAALNAAEIQLSFTKITADWNDGARKRVIGEKFADEGSMLTAGAPIVSVLDISSLLAVIDVIEADYTKIKIGQSANINTDSYPNQQFNGKIVRIAPLLQDASRQARVEIEIANPQLKLKPGMFARVSIAYQTKKNVAAIPAAALCKSKGEQGVYVLNQQDKTVSFIKLQTGIQNSNFVEIISPEIKGEVITLGQDQLDDGSTVMLPKAEGEKPKKQQGTRK
ncbi:MAG: efflux RND transporter periplasmic adaptor subunit [Candidatus Cloacimonas sp.]|nr:efflux RND transporter periplasmic adaptor subunit [Candidatus Cloacimonas sp.]